MNRIFITVMFLCSSVLAFSELAITPDTAAIGDEITISGKYAEGATGGEALLFVDVNKNGVYDDDADFLYYQGTMPIPPDEDNRFEMTITAGIDHDAPFNVPGLWVIIAEDIGGADTATALINVQVTAQYVAGMVRDPEENPLEGVIVWANWEGGRRIVYTGSDGLFTIYLPDETLDNDIEIGVKDEGMFYAHLLPPEPIEITFENSVSDIMLDFTTPVNFVKGRVVDETGAPVPDIRVEIYSTETSFERTIISDGNGYFVVSVTPGFYELEGDRWATRNYMFPELEFEVVSEDDTTLVEYALYSTDEVISGVISGGEGLEFTNIFYIEAVTWTDGESERFAVNAQVLSDGSFSINVSSAFTQYDVEVWAMLPDEYDYSPAFFENVAPGTDDLEIVITVDPSKAAPLSRRDFSAGDIGVTKTETALIIRVPSALIDGMVSVYSATGRRVAFQSIGGAGAVVQTGTLVAGSYLVVVTESGKPVKSLRFIAAR